MKKLLFGLMSFCLLTGSVFAFETTFHIDIDKINITAKGDDLIEGLDKSYNIETKGFSNETIYNEKIEELTKEFVNISLSDKTVAEKQKEFSKYLYVDMSNGANTLASSLLIETYLKSLSENEITYEYIQVIRMVEFEQGILSFAYLPNAVINKLEKDLVLTFWFKENNGEYQIHYAWFSIDDDLESYFKDLGEQENKGDFIGGSYKNISLSGSDMVVSDEVLTNLYTNNIGSSYQITGLTLGGSSVYGSAFTLRSGVVVTTWSLFIQFLSNSDFLYVNDYLGNTYPIEGVIAADTNYDVVILKLTEDVGKQVTLGDSSTLKLDDKLFTINSKDNTGFSINYGSFVKTKDGKLNNLFPVSESDVGSALYDINGNVVGFNTADVINSDLSYANSTNYLKELQSTLVNVNFEDIKYKDIDSFKETYYQPLKEEEKYSNLSESSLKDLLKIHGLDKTITLPLVKSSYQDGILSLRYKNSASESLSTMYLVNDYIEKLKENGYENTYDSLEKKIYKNNKYQVIIKENMSYLIILIVEV